MHRRRVHIRRGADVGTTSGKCRYISHLVRATDVATRSVSRVHRLSPNVQLLAEASAPPTAGAAAMANCVIPSGSPSEHMHARPGHFRVDRAGQFALATTADAGRFGAALLSAARPHRNSPHIIRAHRQKGGP
jgi:hypothetical protein